MEKRLRFILIGVLLCTPTLLAASSAEGTRRIAGSGMDLFFMDDKLFGTVYGHPLWAIYNCGADITGKIDLGGGYHDLVFTYHGEGDHLISGTFGALRLTMGRIEKITDGFVYPVAVGEAVYPFSIRYERQTEGHLVNSTIEGRMGEDHTIRLVADGRLCPFATTGIIMIAAGAALLAE